MLKLNCRFEKANLVSMITKPLLFDASHYATLHPLRNQLSRALGQIHPKPFTPLTIALGEVEVSMRTFYFQKPNCPLEFPCGLLHRCQVELIKALDVLLVMQLQIKVVWHLVTTSI